jgi:hypothetical protein
MRDEKRGEVHRSRGVGEGRLIKQHSHENETFVINAEEINFFTCFKAMLIGLFLVPGYLRQNFKLASMTDKLQLYRYWL